MGEFASKGVAGSGLGLGIAGTALGLLNANGNGGGLLGGLLGGGCQNAQLGQALNALAEKDAKIAELTAMRYSDNQDAAVYKQTLADNKTLRDEMYAYITPIAQESAANRERVAVLEAQQKCEAEKAQLREHHHTEDRPCCLRLCMRPQQSGHRGRLSQGSCQRHHEGGRAAWRDLPAADAPLQRVDVSRRRDSGDGLQSRPHDGAAVTGRSAS